MFHLRRKDLTRAQFKQANLITGISLTLVYLIFFFLNFTSKTISTTTKFVCFGIYFVFYILMAVFVIKYIEERKAMLMCAIGFEVSYLILLLTTPVSSIFLIFPIMLVITVYLNEVLYMYGAVGSLVLIMIKSTVLRFTVGYSREEFLLINVAIICLIICFIGGFNAIRALVKFSKDETDAVNDLLAKQRAVSSEVEAVTDEVASDFKSVVEDLERINENVTSTVMAIDQIAKGSEQTAQAATEQAGMTNEIQERLESTSQIAATAKTTSDDLKKTINLGRAHSEELEKQSKIVDEYETDISNTISELTKEVSEVTHITDTILSISAQTNLLALNASIEAARAGDAGRGFAVVAEEIRQLAEGTKKSTEMITQIMKELTAVTDKVQQAVEKSGESIAAQRDKISLVTESFNVVDKGIEELSTNVDQMNTEVVAVLEANNHIVDNVDTLAAVSEEMSSNAINSANDTTALGKSMEKFTEVIETTSAKISALREIAGK